jgi:hypothetical protein
MDTIFFVEGTQVGDRPLLGILGVARKNFKVAKGLVGAPFGDHAIGVNKVVGHGKCGYPGNLGGN